MSGADDAVLVSFATVNYGRAMGEAIYRALNDDPDNETRAGQWIRRSLAREIAEQERERPPP